MRAAGLPRRVASTLRPQCSIRTTQCVRKLANCALHEAVHVNHALLTVGLNILFREVAFYAYPAAIDRHQI